MNLEIFKKRGFGLVLTVITGKGGAKKTTTATNLAVCLAHKCPEAKICTVDTADNPNMSQWAAIRSQKPDLPKIDCVRVTEATDLTEKAGSWSRRYDFTIVDGEPSLSRLASACVVAADFLVVPVAAGAFDRMTAEGFAQKYAETEIVRSGKNARFVMCGYDPRKTIWKKLEEILKDPNGNPFFPVAQNTLNDRVAYEEVPFEGKGVFEYHDPHARREASGLTDEILRACGLAL